MVTPGIASEYLTARLSCLYILKKILIIFSTIFGINTNSMYNESSNTFCIYIVGRNFRTAITYSFTQ